MPTSFFPSAAATLQVDVSMTSESHFFAGLTGDIAEGGLFVATYRPARVGARVALNVSLDGEVIEARGTVRWARERTGDDVPPGVGIAFDDLPPSSRSAIEVFCSRRAPLYYESDDEVAAAE